MLQSSGSAAHKQLQAFILFKPTHALFLKHIHIHKVVTALSTKDDPPENGQTIVTETCRVLMVCFTNIFNNLRF
jgi:hypothetical protein